MYGVGRCTQDTINTSVYPFGLLGHGRRRWVGGNNVGEFYVPSGDTAVYLIVWLLLDWS